MQDNTQKDNEEEWACRWSPTLGALEDTHQNVWGTHDYFPDSVSHPAVFFGLYGLPDFYVMWRHKGRKCILWAGTDIIHFRNGYWLDPEGTIRLSPAPLARYIRENCESYCENHVEQEALADLGIPAEVVPSFLGKIEEYPECFKPSERVRLYSSVSGNNFNQYGWHKIPALARSNPDVEFHLYGNTKPVPEDLADEMLCPNIIFHGRVSKEEMNSQIKDMTGALRLTQFDGFSEIIAKSLLWGQYPVSLIEYPFTFKPSEIGKIVNMRTPNTKGREWLLSAVNQFPWNIKK